MMKSTTKMASALVGLFALAAPAFAQAPELTELEAAGKVVFEEEIGCIECHGELAKGDVGIGPNIQGQTIEYIQLQMQTNEMMMFDATDEQLAAVEAYLAYLKANNS
ncbi:cytochrome c [Phaeovulum sp.]|uniref:c-type cytochrome n=1 Tax=Phaeovulum sp. TaxID=2934796 RepID=UPI003561DC1A